jgi:hypothetical protein
VVLDRHGDLRASQRAVPERREMRTPKGSSRIARVIAGVAVITGVALPTAAAASPDGRSVTSSADTEPVAVVDGIEIDYLPAGLGRPSDFRYDYSGVKFASRVWESQTPEGWSVDLDVVVMRGAHMRTKAMFRRWFVDYEARSPEPTYIPFGVHMHYGWLAKDQLFWWIRPGLAVSIQLDHSRWSTYDVVQTAWSAHR